MTLLPTLGLPVTTTTGASPVASLEAAWASRVCMALLRLHQVGGHKYDIGHTSNENAQQMRGSCSPLSISMTRRDPTWLRMVTRPAGSAITCPITAGSTRAAVG